MLTAPETPDCIPLRHAESFRLVGVLHLPPLPGAVNYTGVPVREIAERAAADAVALRDAGFTHVMVQDASDMPQAVRVGARPSPPSPSSAQR